MQRAEEAHRVPLPDPGLTAAEAAERLRLHGPNVLPAPPTPSVWLRLVRAVREPLSILLLAAAAISGLVLGHRAEGAAIVAIVVLNAAILVVQERGADRAVSALAAMTAPNAVVRRDGGRLVVPAAEVVPGDLIELAAGDRVAADAVVRVAASAAFDESLLTGESVPSPKHAGDEVFAGTLAVRGRASATVTKVGTATAIGAIAGSLAAATEPPLVRELRQVATRLSVAAAVVGALLAPLAYVRTSGDDALVDAALAGIALAVAAVPEGLATVVATSLALGARRMARRGAIVRRLPAIETLGSTTVICSDKTGTLTTGRLAVTAVEPGAAGAGALWDAALRCTDATDGVGDPIDVAIQEAAAAAGIPSPTGERIAEIPFDAERRSMTVVDRVGASPRLSLKGAPEIVLARCRTGADRDRLTEAAAALARGGQRVLAVAGGDTADLDADALDPLGLLAFADPLRDSTVDAVTACRRAGIRLVLVTGDHVETASAIAVAAGLEHAAVVTGAELAELPADARAERLRAASVVARVDPQTKVALVDAHRARGEVVAMTGDGVNDAPALRHADVGVALAGEGGSDVAREAASIVVTDGDLGTIVTAVREGRRIYRNLAAVVAYLLTGNLSEVLVVVGAVVLLPDLAVPLLPVQLLWVNLVTDGLPAVALGMDEQAVDPIDGPPRRLHDGILSGRRLAGLVSSGLMLAAPVVAAGAAGLAAGWSDEEVRSLLLVALLLAHLALAYVVRATRWAFEAGWSRNRSLLLAIGGSLLLQVPVFATSTGRDVMQLVAMPPSGWLLALGAGATGIALLELLRAGERRFGTNVPARRRTSPRAPTDA